MTAKQAQAAWDALRRERDMLSEKVKELEGECGFDQRNAAASQSESESLLERCDELAAQVDAMRDALIACSKDVSNAAFVHYTMREALALPNTAADILRKRDADLIARTIALMGTSFDGTIEDFQNELDARHG